MLFMIDATSGASKTAKTYTLCLNTVRLESRSKIKSVKLGIIDLSLDTSHFASQTYVIIDVSRGTSLRLATRGSGDVLVSHCNWADPSWSERSIWMYRNFDSPGVIVLLLFRAALWAFLFPQGSILSI